MEAPQPSMLAAALQLQSTEGKKTLARLIAGLKADFSVILNTDWAAVANEYKACDVAAKELMVAKILKSIDFVQVENAMKDQIDLAASRMINQYHTMLGALGDVSSPALIGPYIMSNANKEIAKNNIVATIIKSLHEVRANIKQLDGLRETLQKNLAYYSGELLSSKLAENQSRSKIRKLRPVFVAFSSHPWLTRTIHKVTDGIAHGIVAKKVDDIRSKFDDIFIAYVGYLNDLRKKMDDAIQETEANSRKKVIHVYIDAFVELVRLLCLNQDSLSIYSDKMQKLLRQTSAADSNTANEWSRNVE